MAPAPETNRKMTQDTQTAATTEANPMAVPSTTPNAPLGSKLLLIIAAAAFFGWIAWLGFAALKKSHAPIVSHVQAAVATAAVVVELHDTGPKVVIEEKGKLWGSIPPGEIEVANLPDARGFAGPGKYLLYLHAPRGMWLVVGQQRSPGNDLGGVGQPIIYPWSDDVRMQAERLHPPAPAK
jgi:hypothetical protein